jgi:hypothetical protein
VAQWRIYFLAAWVAISVLNMFSSYFLERFAFIIAAYAAVLELGRRSSPLTTREPVSPFLEQSSQEAEAT